VPKNISFASLAEKSRGRAIGVITALPRKTKEDTVWPPLGENHNEKSKIGAERGQYSELRTKTKVTETTQKRRKELSNTLTNPSPLAVANWRSVQGGADHKGPG